MVKSEEGQSSLLLLLGYVYTGLIARVSEVVRIASC